ncbi:outer membrane homotrimeric porin [Desulfovibrio piger]|uniref:outer membrane homotrimeric porin n=1 Tax=Desulfovibrio piger TaxID=901 RepID=UPI003AB26D77
MKKIFTLMLAAGMLLGAASGARAIDFKASGEWLVGFGLGDGSLIKDVNDQKRHHDDTFNAGQRIRLQLDAVASETLSGTVFFEIGDQMWGQSESGGALGADSTSVVKLKNAYIDWMVPNTDLKLRMGLQAVALPNVAGGSAIMDGDAAAVVASYQFNENVGLTALWMRPLNDNYTGTNADGEAYGNGYKNYLDNMDLFALMLPLKFDGVELTPWAMYGLQGKNTRFNEGGVETADGALNVTLPGYYPGMNFGPGGLGHTGKSYGSMFWAGLPVAITAFDPLNIEFDINYGYVEAMGRYDVLKRGVESVLGNSKREGWLVKALVEYKMDWGTPGIFGWYASGDDGNVKNGSERLPSIAGSGNFTSFMGDGNLAWGTGYNFYDNNLTYAGTWGIGLQIADVSFVEDLKHTFRVAYWGGTNSPSMVKYMGSAVAWDDTTAVQDGPYLTTNDGLLEFNLVNSWQIYENLEANLELGYIINMMDRDTWDKSYVSDRNWSKQDAWKAQLIFAYSF